MKLPLRGFVLTALILYFLILLYWMFIGFGRTHIEYETYVYNLKPFSTIKQYVTGYDHYNFHTWAINLFGNIGVFVPFGLGLPYLFRWSWFKFTVIFVISITVLEWLQMRSKRGSFDIDDIILNTLGAAIGYLVYRLCSIIYAKFMDKSRDHSSVS